MREPTFLILSALADGPKHGYAIIQDAVDQSEGRVRLQAGTLYAALDRLASEGLVSPPARRSSADVAGATSD